MRRIDMLLEIVAVIGLIIVGFGTLMAIKGNREKARIVIALGFLISASSILARYLTGELEIMLNIMMANIPIA